MVCIVCLKDNSPVNVSIRYEGIQFETTLCADHGFEFHDVARKWIRTTREAAIVNESEQNKDKQDWRQHTQERK